MNSEIILKEKRSNLLNEMIKQIKIAIEKNEIKGEISSKIFIYSRLADYTYYSEVSIRKFLTGTIPKDISSFVQGIVQYCNLVKVEEQFIEEFIKEYVQASNAVIIDSTAKLKTKTNVIPQDLTSIIRPKKLTNFLDSLLKDNVNIAYIYGYKLSGKTKSVMAYINDVINKNVYDNIVWADIKLVDNQIKQIIDAISSIAFSDIEQLNEEVKKEKCFKFLQDTKSILIIDFDNICIEEETIEIIKEIAKQIKIIIISSENFKKYEEKLNFYSKVFCTNDYVQKDEFEQMLKLNEQDTSIIENSPEIVNELYKLTGGFPFASVYVLRKMIEDNKLGITFNDCIKRYTDYKIEEYEELASKIIYERWENLNNLAKQILLVSAKFNTSVSIKLVAEICSIQVTANEWKEALKQCYENDLLNPIISNNPRISMNNMIRILVLQYENKENFNNKLFLNKIANFYINLTTYIGECYNDLDKLKLLDELDEWNIVLQVLEYLKNAEMNEEYISIVKELKYYIYVRGMWSIGEASLHLKRASLARKINNINEELEGLCDYINICSKSKNTEEAEKYLQLASEIVKENEDSINKRIMCLYNHVRALYLYNCRGEYTQSYDIWNYNKKNYSKYVSSYRNLVNDLWITRSYIYIENDSEKICKELEEKITQMKKENFVRAELDYELLLIGVLIQNLKKQTEDSNLLERIGQELNKCEKLFNTKSYKDVRNEAEYFKYRAMMYSYKKDDKLKDEYIKKAIENYRLMNCVEEIANMEKYYNI
ncbi:MAG: hypothetical protein J6A89_05335 [Clostridia bacterium]|nr:hypothetical protein [Clostridia bacterium]